MSAEQQPLFDTEDHSTPLSFNQHRAAEMLSGGAKRIAVTEALDISLRELAKWERMPTFIAEQKRIRGEARDLCVAELRGMADLAIGRLKKILSDDDTPPATAASTAFKVLSIIGVEAEVFEAPQPEVKPLKKAIDPETLRRISAEIYGVEGQ